MKRTIFLILQLLFVSFGFAQDKRPFQSDVETIKKYDKLFKPVENPILFVGSSSIRKWDDIQQVFGSYNVINRGVGGTVIDDIIYFADDLIFAYKPRQIVIYVGENNLPRENETAETILEKTKQLYRLIREKLPEVPIVYIAMKPSPSREKFREKCKASNDLIRQFLSGEKNTSFVDVYSLMLKNGQQRPELFVEDMLHMNAQGYEIWRKAVQPKLLKWKR